MQALTKAEKYAIIKAHEKASKPKLPAKEIKVFGKGSDVSKADVGNNLSSDIASMVTVMIAARCQIS